MNALLKLLKHRGFLFPTAEIYNNGTRGLFDFGPLGVELKRNLKSEWWLNIVHQRPDCLGMDGAVLGPSSMWHASGHLENFHDILVDCRLSKERFRLDHGLPIRWEQQSDTSLLIPLKARDAQQAREWQQLIEKQLAPGALIRRDGNQLWLHCSRIVQPEPDVPGYLELRTVQSTTVELPYLGYVHPENNSPFLTDARPFHLMFKTTLGSAVNADSGNGHKREQQLLDQLQHYLQEHQGQLPTAEQLHEWMNSESTPEQTHQDTSNAVYLRPETAQSIFVNFLNCQRALNTRLPFGIAQVGKAFRNEIRPGSALYRTAEFDQMELEWFCKPSEADRWFDYWQTERFEWWKRLFNNPSMLRLRPHASDELAHYAKQCTDIEFEFPFGWGELEGVANRTDFDLKQHTKHSGQSLEYFDDAGPGKPERYHPFVIESSAGLSRACLALLSDAYCEEERTSATGESVRRTVLKLHPRLAPIKAAILPLLPRNTELTQQSNEIWSKLRQKGIFSRMDATGRSIGKRYARHDEIGTPFCITVDVQTLTDRKVTIRDRNTAEQERVDVEEVADRIQDKLTY